MALTDNPESVMEYYTKKILSGSLPGKYRKSTLFEKFVDLLHFRRPRRYIFECTLFDKFAQTKPIPENKSQTMKWRSYNEILNTNRLKDYVELHDDSGNHIGWFKIGELNDN